MECMARSHRVVQVIGEGGVGYLYFDWGQIRARDHRATDGRSRGAGDPRLDQRLVPELRPLLADADDDPDLARRTDLQAAQLRDERRASNLVAFPARGAAGDEVDRYEELELSELDEDEEETAAAREDGGGDMRSPGSDEAALTPKPVANGVSGVNGGRSELGPVGDFSVMMRLGPNGAVVSNRGGSEELAETVAYSHRLLQLTGELLGFDEFSAVECGFVDGRCIVFSDGDEIVALRPRPEVNLQALREKLGL